MHAIKNSSSFKIKALLVQNKFKIVENYHSIIGFKEMLENFEKENWSEFAETILVALKSKMEISYILQKKISTKNATSKFKYTLNLN
ncbi:hypothetical protein BpHYR1_011567 [Brachionus plicatilis]|uniref:Uncharacterized protein n=1 Tax=Brachionus plicatilis TaxID=10195 RepID=A0A3M7SV13_BRAPC|nr:hypothetical protein BpHYR1_011567 [Brachionus plicatilis]